MLRSIALSVVAALPLSAAETFQVRAAEIRLGDGQRIEDGVLLVEDGRIAKVGRGVEVDDGLPLVSHGGVVTAGIVACQTEAGMRGGAQDVTRSLLPEARVIDGFDPGHSQVEKALAAGITTMVVVPDRGNVAGGVSAVVKTAGGSVLAEERHLALSFSKDALAFGRSAADGLEETGSSRRGLRAPTSYSGALAALRRSFESPDDPESPFARAARGELSVLMEAWDRNEVARAVGFAKELGLRGAVRGAALGRDQVELLSDTGLGVVLGPSPALSSRFVEAARALGDAGVPLAFAMDAPQYDPEHLRLSAAMAVSAGADPTVVWRALTVDAARIAGVERRVGELERGFDADFVLWSGDPLDLTSRVEAVYVDGRQVYRGDDE